MMKTRNLVVAATTAMVLLGTLSACSLLPGSNGGGRDQSQTETQNDTQTQSDQGAIESYVEAERSQLPAVMDANPGVFSDITVEAVGSDTAVFTYTYADVMDAGATASNLDDLAQTLQDGCDESVFPAMTGAGVEGEPHVTYTYLNSDGSEIWTKTFSPS